MKSFGVFCLKKANKEKLKGTERQANIKGRWKWHWLVKY